jgi:hypothetical protein
VALVLAAIGDQAPGYDGPGPFIYLAFAGLVALARWRFAPLLAVVMAIFFLLGGLSPYFVRALTDPGRPLVFAAGWLQMLSFVATVVFAVSAVAFAHRSLTDHDNPTASGPRGGNESMSRPFQE